jgi:hypothetical protein
MKNTLTYFLLCLFLSPTVYAKKEGKLAPVANSTVQFLENKGQITDQHGIVRRDIDVKIEANGVTMFVGNGEMHYQWVKSHESEVMSREPGADKLLPGVFSADWRRDRGSDSRRTNSEVEIYRMDVKLEGANKNVEVIFEEPTGYYENYYLAHTGEEGVTAKGFQRVVYKDIYPNIDLVLYTPPAPLKGSDIANGKPMSNIQHPISNIKYDFIVHPGGNPADIKLRYEGAAEVKIVGGSLVATTSYGTITEAAPYSYSKETSETVASAYKLSGNTLSFAVGSYTGTLVIDPTLKWGTYFGGSNRDYFADLATSFDMHVYATGATLSTANIATTGTHKVSLVGDHDAFLVKIDNDGFVKWGTYYGGTGSEFGAGVTTDFAGNIYVCGTTLSPTGIATNGSHQDTLAQSSMDAFLVKFDSTGQRIWGTYYGGNSDDNALDVVTDNNGHVYICGTTNSTNNIASTGCYQDTIDTPGTNYEYGYIAKFNTSGSRIWGTYYGTPNLELVTITTDGSNIYTGGYHTGNGLASTGAHQVNNGGSQDGIVIKFSSAGQRIWSTYYGGQYDDLVYELKCDNTGNLYATGLTESNNGIASTNANRTSISGTEDAFLVKFNSNGVRQWGTYYGGNFRDWGVGITFCPNGLIYLTGSTNSISGLSTQNAYKTTSGGWDAFFAEFTSNGNLTYSSYYGGPGQDGVYNTWLRAASGMACNLSGTLFFGNTTVSTSGISTNNSYRGWEDAFVVAFETDTTVYIREPFVDTALCPGDSIQVVYAVNTAFKAGNIFTVQLSDTAGDFTNPLTLATRADTVGDTVWCVVLGNTLPGSKYHIRVKASNPNRTSWSNLLNIHIKGTVANFNNNSNSPVCTSDTLHLTGSSTSTGITWAWTGPNSFSSSAKDSFIANAQFIDSGKYILKATLNSTGCFLYDTTMVEMRLTPDKPTAGSNSPVCETLPLTLTTSSSTNGVNYTWSGPGSYSSTTQNPTVTTNASSTHAGDYISTATLNGCNSRDTTTIVVLPKPAKPTAAATNSPLCVRQDLQLTATTVTGASYTWYGPSAFTANTQNPVRANIQMGDAGAYYVYATVSGCVSDTDSVVVTVNTDPFVNIFPTPGASVCQGKQVIFTSVPTNGGSTSYNWLVNGISTGSTGTTYNTTTLNNGDAVSCAMTSTGTCATPFIDTSNAITMTVQPVISPTVTITADNMPPWNGGLTVTFTANPTHGGNAPEYQWKRNGADVVGATGATWGVVVNALNPNEDICVVLKSSYECAVPDTAMSNCITSAFTGVGDVAANNGFKIYPNPTSTILHIEGVEPGTTIELIDVLGRKCATRQLVGGTVALVDVSGLVPGVYVVKVNGVVAGRVVKE